MVIPCKFPRHADVIADEARRFRACSPAERSRQIVELVYVAEAQLAAARNRSAIEAACLAEEEKWRSAHRQVFQQHEPSK